MIERDIVHGAQTILMICFCPKHQTLQGTHVMGVGLQMKRLTLFMKNQWNLKMSKPALKAVPDTYTRPADFYPPHVIRNLTDGNRAQGYMYDKEIVNLIYAGEKGGVWKYADRDHPCYMDTAHPIWIKLV